MDQLSEIQSEGLPPPPPAPTGNARADSLARAEHFKQTTAFFEKQGAPAFVNRTQVVAAPVQPSGPQPNAADLALVKETQADALKRYPGNNQVRAIIDRMYVDVHSGKPLDHAALEAAFTAATETSQTRAFAAAVDALGKATDADGNVSHDAIPRELTHGYSLPPGLYVAESTIQLLATAKEMQLTQSQIDKYIELQRDE